MRTIAFKQNDIIAVLLEDDFKAPPSVPFLFRHLSDDWIKADALPAIETPNRGDAFLASNLYTSKGNLAVAKLIKEKIYEIIKLY
jgi:hypothetical protein